LIAFLASPDSEALAINNREKSKRVPRGGYWADIVTQYEQQRLELKEVDADRMKEVPCATEDDIKTLLPAVTHDDHTDWVKVGAPKKVSRYRRYKYSVENDFKSEYLTYDDYMYKKLNGGSK